MKPAEMDKIHIRDLTLEALIGVNPEERHIRQELVFNIILYTDQRAAAETDDFTRTVDYDGTTGMVKKLVEDSSFELIESLAAAVAGLLLDIEGVMACNVILDKPGVVPGTRSVAVEIYRER